MKILKSKLMTSLVVLTLSPVPHGAVAAEKAHTILELRQYTLHPGQRDTLIGLFDDYFVEGQEKDGMRVIGQFRDRDNPDRFVWLRSFADMPARAKSLQSFYYGPIWQAHNKVANGTMVDSDNVLLLHPLRPDTGFAPSATKLPPTGTRGPGKGVMIASILYVQRKTPDQFGEFFEREMKPQWQKAGASALAELVSDHSANNFPKLPLRENENVFVWFSMFPDQAAAEKHQKALSDSPEWRVLLGKLSEWTYQPIQTLHLEPTARSHLQSASSAPSTSSLDVQYYRLNLRVDPSSKMLLGKVDVRVKRLSSASRDIALDLASALAVEAVTVNGKPARFTHEDDRLHITADKLPANGKSAVISVTYRGTPQGNGFTFAEHAGDPAISSYGMPFTARQWWPSNDDPADKADSADILITVPQPLMAASNGKLIATATNADSTRTYHWRSQYPIYPDTISVAIGNYTVIADHYESGRTRMPLQFYVFPADEMKARADFGVLKHMMRHHVARFGEYPFFREKYGVAEFMTHSFREHQTLPSYSAKLITGDHQNDPILAHELAHQWFGNSLTVRDWRHVWLNEGFSTYAASLWQEDQAGAAGYREAMEKLDDSELYGPVFISDVSDNKKLFSAATFQKGAWVLHMLRHVMGDEKFFTALRQYVAEFRYRNVATEDFRAVCERVQSRNLGWFFDQWVYGVSRPTYQASWTRGEGGRAPQLTIRQTQLDAPVFTMPVDVLLTTSAGPSRFVVWNDQKEQTFPIALDGAAARGEISKVTLDPNGWILKRVVDSVPAG